MSQEEVTTDYRQRQQPDTPLTFGLLMPKYQSTQAIAFNVIEADD